MYTAEDHTFVVCAYKENPFLETTISSLLSQKVLGRILVSTSTPNDYIERIAQAHGIPVTINTYPRLAGDDWNYGYNAAKTPLVTIAHQDDIYEPTYLERILCAANKYRSSEVALLFSDYYKIRNDERVDRNTLLLVKRMMNRPLAYPRLNKSRFLKRRILSLGDSICCPAVTLVKDNLGADVFDTTYVNSCDYRTWVNLACTNKRFVYVPERLIGHRIYQESATSRNLQDNIRKVEDIEILSSLWPRPLARMINAIYSLSEKSNELG